MATVQAVRAPFTTEQVASLNAYQDSGAFHPLTCGSEDCAEAQGARTALVASTAGWACPECGWAQDWAHESVADGSWRQFEGISVTVNGGPPVKGELASGASS